MSVEASSSSDSDLSPTSPSFAIAPGHATRTTSTSSRTTRPNTSIARAGTTNGLLSAPPRPRMVRSAPGSTSTRQPSAGGASNEALTQAYVLMSRQLREELPNALSLNLAAVLFLVSPMTVHEEETLVASKVASRQWSRAPTRRPGGPAYDEARAKEIAESRRRQAEEYEARQLERSMSILAERWVRMRRASSRGASSGATPGRPNSQQ